MRKTIYLLFSLLICSTNILKAQNLNKNSKEQLDFEEKESLVFNDKNLTEFPKEILNLSYLICLMQMSPKLKNGLDF